MNMNDFRLDGKVALVTGASYGIGFAIQPLFRQPALPLFLTTLSKNWLTKAWRLTKKPALKHTVMFAT